MSGVTPQEAIDHRLLRGELLIDGAWRPADSGRVSPVTDPASGNVVAEVAQGNRADAREAIEAADRALGPWGRMPAKDRAILLRSWHQLIVEHADALAAILVAEQGKPLAEARGEILYGAAFIEWFAEEGKRAYGDVIPSNALGRRILAIKQPVGVCAAITPWNFPSAMVLRKAAPALAAGCTMVLKPAPQTPLSALALGELALRAEIPAGVLNIVPGPAQVVGSELVESEVVRMLTFTGSTEVGKLLMARCADTVKRVSLELGGNAPLIVFDDADLDAAVHGAMTSKFRNSGQTCVCANRILVQHSVHDPFVERLSAATEGLTVGPGFDPGSEQGPLIDEEAVSKVESHLADALALGARVVTGGRRHQRGGTYFEPTVLTGVRPEMLIAQE